VKSFFLGVAVIDGIWGIIYSLKPQTSEAMAVAAYFCITAFIAFSAFAILRAIEKAGTK
jgi:hypothetical protein